MGPDTEKVQTPLVIKQANLILNVTACVERLTINKESLSDSAQCDICSFAKCFFLSETNERQGQ